jgi:hypothetical protein
METQGNTAMQNPAVDEISTPLTLGNYIVMMIVSAIPVVGFIMLLIWSFSGNTNINKKNYARAALIMMIVVGILSIIVGGAMMAAIASMFAPQ